MKGRQVMSSVKIVQNKVYNAVYSFITQVVALIKRFQVIGVPVSYLVNKFTFQTLLLHQAGAEHSKSSGLYH